jgi:hypothetical protein
MEKLTITPDLRARLNGLNHTLEMCDESGLTLGRFVLEEEYRQFLWAWANSEVTEEELENSRKEYREHGGLTTAEAIAYIKKLAGE